LYFTEDLYSIDVIYFSQFDVLHLFTNPAGLHLSKTEWDYLVNQVQIHTTKSGHISVLKWMVCSTPPCGHAPTYQIYLTYLERQKKLWSGQALLRRSGRKNQTKTICLPSFEGETVAYRNDLRGTLTFDLKVK
jgi:hypothetical protein